MTATPSTSSIIPSLSASIQPPASNSARDHIISVLDIPAHLVDRSNSNLRNAYAKYLAYLDAQKTLAKAVTDGKWVLAKQPTGENLIEVFISKSAFFKNYNPLFPQVQDYPLLHLWLKNDEDVPSDMEAWGVQKNVYMFRDLKDYLVRMKRKGKGGKAGGSDGNTGGGGGKSCGSGVKAGGSGGKAVGKAGGSGGKAKPKGKKMAT